MKQPDKKTFHYEFMHDQGFLEYPQDWITGSHSDDLYSIFGETYLLVNTE